MIEMYTKYIGTYSSFAAENLYIETVKAVIKANNLVYFSHHLAKMYYVKIQIHQSHDGQQDQFLKAHLSTA